MRHELKLFWQDLVTKVRNSGYRQTMIVGLLVYLAGIWLAALFFYDSMSTVSVVVFVILTLLTYWGFLHLMSVLETRSNTRKGE